MESGLVPALIADSDPSLTSRSLPKRPPEDAGVGLGGRRIVDEWADWLTDQWTWDWFFTGTFRDFQSGTHTAIGWGLSDRRYAAWFARLNARAGLGNAFWFRAREPHKDRSTTHFHALIGGVQNLRRSVAWEDWYRENGFARVEPITSRLDVARYVAKYVLKADGQLEFSADAGLFKRERERQHGNNDVPF